MTHDNDVWKLVCNLLNDPSHYYPTAVQGVFTYMSGLCATKATLLVTSFVVPDAGGGIFGRCKSHLTHIAVNYTSQLTQVVVNSRLSRDSCPPHTNPLTDVVDVIDTPKHTYSFMSPAAKY